MAEWQDFSAQIFVFYVGVNKTFNFWRLMMKKKVNLNESQTSASKETYPNEWQFDCGSHKENETITQQE